MSAIKVRKQKEASNTPIIQFPKRWRNSQAFAQGILTSHDLIFIGSFFLCNLSSLSPPAASSNRRRKQLVVIAGQAKLWAKPNHAGEEREAKERAGAEATWQAPDSSPVVAFATLPSSSHMVILLWLVPHDALFTCVPGWPPPNLLLISICS